MAWLSDFYTRRKNPWLGFVLVMLFAPFGFLYHSWKTAILVLFVVGPLWIIFLRHTPYDLIDNPLAHYMALTVLAAFASLQIRAKNGQTTQTTSKPAVTAETTAFALSLLPNEVERMAFQEYLLKNPSVSEKLQNHSALLYEPQDPFTRWQIALLLSSYSTVQAQAGDFFGASGSLVYAMQFFQENPLAWAGMAELYTAWEDRIGARWANKVLKFKPANSNSEIINRLYLDSAAISALEEMKERMVFLMRTCAEHPEWRDSYKLKKGNVSFCPDL